MRVTHTTTYDAPLSEVYAMLTDKTFRERASEAIGTLSADVTIEERGGAKVVHIDQVQPVQGVPSFVTKFAGETTRAVIEENWTTESASTLSVTTPGKPTKITGDYTLTEQGGKTIQSFSGECKVSVPLVGGKLEKVMAGLFIEGREAESTAGAAWLAGDRGA